MEKVSRMIPITVSTRLFTVIVLIFFNLLSILKSSAQTEWAPIGAKWVNEENEYEDGKLIYSTFKSIKDTLVLGKNCRKIETYSHMEKRHDHFPPTEITDTYGYFYLFVENDKVYYSTGDSLLLMYDFNLKEGDTFGIYQRHKFQPDSFTFQKYIVTRADSIQISGKILRRQHLQLIDNTNLGPYMYFYNGYIVEKIGYLNYMFGDYFEPFDKIPPHLKCYIDQEISYQDSGVVNCNGFENISENSKSVKIELFPNPATSEIKLRCTGSKPYDIQIVNCLGIIMKELKNSYSEINIFNIESFEKGIYLMILKTENSRSVKTFIKD